MRSKTSFGSWIQRLFAAVMRNFFPTLAVKHFTLRPARLSDNQYSRRARLFCPGVKKELKIIEKLGYNEEELQNREWSRGTRLELLKRKNYALLGRSHTKEEFDIVCQNGDVDRIIEVFLECTPTRDYLRDFLSCHSDKVEAIILKSPSIFNDLRLEDFMTLPTDIALKYLSSLMSYNDCSSSKAKKSALKWAETIAITWLRQPIGMEPAKQKLYEKAVEVLIAEDYNVTFMLKDLEHYHYSSYCRVRDCAKESKHCSLYVVEVLPRKWNYCWYEDISKAKCVGDKLTAEQDAKIWMNMVCDNMTDLAVCKAVLDNCSHLKYPVLHGYGAKVRERLIENVHGYDLIKRTLTIISVGHDLLYGKLVNSIETIAQAQDALQILPEGYQNTVRQIMVEMTTADNCSVLLSYYPFADWPLKTAENAVRLLIHLKQLGNQQLSSLDNQLQKVAQNELEIQSEMEILSDLSGDRLDRMVSREEKLHPEVEVELFKLPFGYNMQKKRYVQLHRMSDASFTALANTGYDPKFMCCISELKRWVESMIELHAQTWGLTQDNYNALMKSKDYNHLAPLLKKYVKTN